VGRHADQLFGGKAGQRARKVFAHDGGRFIRAQLQRLIGLVQRGQLAGQQPLFQQAFDLFAGAKRKGACGLGDGAGLFKKVQRLVKIIQHRRTLRVAQRQIFVHDLRQGARVQQGKVVLHHGLQPGLFLAVQRVGTPAQQCRRLSGVAEQHLARGRNVNFAQLHFPPLAQQVKAGHRVHHVAPKLHTHGAVHIRGVQIHNAAAHRKLARPLHAVTPVVARRRQPGNQVFLAQAVALFQREGVCLKFGAGHRALQCGLQRHGQQVAPLAHNVAQHRNAPVFKLVALAKGGVQCKVAHRAHRAARAKKGGIGGKAGRFGFARSHHDHGALQVTRQRGSHLGTRCGRQAKQRRRRAATLQGGLQPRVFGCST